MHCRKQSYGQTTSSLFRILTLSERMAISSEQHTEGLPCESIPMEEIVLNTSIQAVVARVKLHRNISICNIYASDSHFINSNLLNQIFQQLPQPTLIVGDFNAYNILWRSRDTRSRGRKREDFLMNNILNDGSPTRITRAIETAIDLSICSLI